MAGKISGLDERYTIALEYCGYESPHYVVRFCGDYLGNSEIAFEAESLAIQHNRERLNYVAN